MVVPDLTISRGIHEALYKMARISFLFQEIALLVPLFGAVSDASNSPPSSRVAFFKLNCGDINQTRALPIQVKLKAVAHVPVVEVVAIITHELNRNSMFLMLVVSNTTSQAFMIVV